MRAGDGIVHAVEAGNDIDDALATDDPAPVGASASLSPHLMVCFSIRGCSQSDECTRCRLLRSTMARAGCASMLNPKAVSYRAWCVLCASWCVVCDVCLMVLWPTFLSMVLELVRE